MNCYIDYILEHKCSWMIWDAYQRKSFKFKYIIEAIKDKSKKHYGIVLCNTLVDITELKKLFRNNKIAFIKLCYNIIKQSIKINNERLIWNIKRKIKPITNDIILN